jgi:hypothetical protein
VNALKALKQQLNLELESLAHEEHPDYDTMHYVIWACEHLEAAEEEAYEREDFVEIGDDDNEDKD